MDQDESGYEGRPRPSHIVLHGDKSPKKRGHSPQFFANVCCGQTAGWITMPLGMEVGFVPGDTCARWGPSSPQKGCTAAAPTIRPMSIVTSWMDQYAIWYGGRRRTRAHCVRWRLSSPKKGGTATPNFQPCLLGPNDWMDEGGTWYGGRPQTRQYCVRSGPIPPEKK